ncbi:MAG: MBL fold metallo-hydrolase [Pseudomonadota bacterium]
MHRAYTAAFAAICLSASPALAQRDFSAVEIKVTEVTDGIYMLEGSGGNIGLSVGEDGAFVIDDQFAPLSDKIMAAIKTVTDKPVEFVLNTHHHGDHTGGNEAFGETGAYIVAHDNVRGRLAAAEDTPDAALPVITFSESATFHRNDQEIHIFHPDNAHTDGDAIVYFRDANVVHMGDVFFSRRYPFIDVSSGGDIDGFISALEATAAMVDDDVKIIPGHGPLSTKADIEATAAMLNEVRARVQALIDQGLDEDAAAAADPLADLNEEWGWRFIDGERMTRAAYQTLAE